LKRLYPEFVLGQYHHGFGNEPAWGRLSDPERSLKRESGL